MLYEIRNKDGITRYITTSEGIAEEYAEHVEKEEGYTEIWSRKELLYKTKGKKNRSRNTITD